MRSKTARVIAFVLVFLTGAGCSAGPKLGFDLPEGWVETKASTGQIVLVNEERRADVMLAPLSDAATAAKYSLPGVEVEAAIRQTLTQLHGPMLLPMAEEDALEIEPLPGSSAPALYFTLTMPEGRLRTVGLVWLDGVEVTMIGSTATREDVDELLAVMASVRTEN